MKTLPAMIAATLLLASVSATASTGILIDKSDSKVLHTVSASSASAAYELGVNKLASLQNVSPRQLDLALGNGGNVIADTVHLKNGSYVTTQERFDANGQKNFIGLVKVAFGYSELDEED